MKFARTLLAAVAAAAFVTPAAAQTAQPETTAQPEAAAQPETQQNAATQAQPGTPPRATPADLVVGAPVLGGDGKPVGTIESADGTGAVVNTGAAKGRLNLDAFYKDDRGLLIGYTRQQLESLVAAQPGTDDAGE